MNNDLVANYKPSAETVELVANTPIVLLVGISGAGKDSIKKILLQTGKYHHIVSHTSRKIRVNGGVLEQTGVEYHFVPRQEMLKMAAAGEFVEIKEFSGNLYGTSAVEIKKAQDEHKIAITDLEIQGVAEYKNISSHVIAEFILPPDYDEWQRRLYARYGVHKADPEDIANRMKTAILELEEALSRPYYHYIINSDLHEAVEVADKIAHGDDSFNKIDQKVHYQAKELLKAVRKQSALLSAV